MAVYFKYASAKDFDSVPILHQYISVGNLKLKIAQSKRFGWGKDFDLVVTNAQTSEKYVDEQTLIPRNTSVLIRRVPGLPCLPIVITKPEQYQLLVKEDPISTNSTQSQNLESCDDDFGDDIYAIPKLMPTNPVQNAPASTDNEATQMKNLIDTPSLVQFGWKKPPPGYVCHRCNVPGHFIQHCPTNGDPSYDIKKLQTATPKSTLSGGSLPSTSCGSHIPPELFCAICKQVMKDAAIAGKCCFRSFCNRCIRDHILSNSMCICGARKITVDTILPNLTLRNTIAKYLESDSVKHEVQDMASSHNGQTKVAESRKRAVEENPGEAEKMKRRKKGVQSYMVSMATAPPSNPCCWSGMQYMNYGLPLQSYMSPKTIY